jgi:hypothetical protein
MLVKEKKLVEKFFKGTEAAQKMAVNGGRFDLVTEHEGKYLLVDGFRVLIFTENPDLPLGGNVVNYFNQDNDADFQDSSGNFVELEIPYTLDEIKKWWKWAKPRRYPFSLGVQISFYSGDKYIGINGKFLIEAMELTKSNVIQFTDKGKMRIRSNDGRFTYIIMPVVENTEKPEMNKVEHSMTYIEEA